MALLLAAAAVPVPGAAFESSKQELSEALHARPNFDHGAELFRNCAVCHGPSGGGTVDGGVPRIAGQHVSVLAKQLVDYRHDRRWDLRMEHFADNHHLVDAQAIADVTNYIHNLSAETPPGFGKGDLADHGAAVYQQRCEACHGKSAEGNSKAMVPRLAGQHYEYLMRQIYDAVDGRRPNFPPTHVRLLARLERADIVGVADFLSRLKVEQPPPSPVQAAVSPPRPSRPGPSSSGPAAPETRRASFP
jgi:cytochrome c553